VDVAIVLPIYNEAVTLSRVFEKLREFSDIDIIVIDDGSTDTTSMLLEKLSPKVVIAHPTNLGYGKTLMDGFEYVIKHGYRYCITMDSDDQHEPAFIPCFLEKLEKFDIVSGSRYLNPLLSLDPPPEERVKINQIITEKLRDITGYAITDSFCGFKGYRIDGLKKMQLTEVNYGFPIQVWIQAFRAHLTVTECAVPLIYRDHSRNFNNQFSNRDERLQHYLEVLERELKK
jgi:dolichol-phosphate mannosyltransferase